MSQDELTQKLTSRKLTTEKPFPSSSTPRPSSLPEQAFREQYKSARLDSLHLSGRQKAMIRLMQEECRKFCLSLFFRDHPVRSLGITSSIAGEGKSFVAALLAQVLAQDSTSPILLIECNWEHASLGDYFGCPRTPGVAEWLRGECSEHDAQYQILENLTFMPAGNAYDEPMKLLQKLKKLGLQKALAHHDETILIELPPLVTTAYSMFAASLVEALVLVVRAGVTPDDLIAEACGSLGTLPVEGVILNQVEDHRKLRHAIRKKL